MSEETKSIIKELKVISKLMDVCLEDEASDQLDRLILALEGSEMKSPSQPLEHLNNEQ